MEIRFAKAQDVPGMIKLLRQLCKVRHQQRPDLFRENGQAYSASQLLDMLDKPEAPVFVAVEEDQVLGYGICRLEVYRQHPVLQDRVSLRIDDLWATEEQIGAALCRHILEYAKYRNCYNVTLNVWRCDDSAVSCYRSLGMKDQKITMEAIL